MKFAIIGSRNFPDKQLVENITQQLIDDHLDFILISGGCSGVDTWAFDIAIKNTKLSIVHYADWDKHGKRAGFLRNHDIIHDANMVYAFWDGVSKGTKHSINLAIKAGKPLNIYVRKILPKEPPIERKGILKWESN